MSPRARSDRGSATMFLVGGLALVALGAVALLVYNLMDDGPRKRRPAAPLVVAGDPPGTTPAPTTPTPSTSAAPTPAPRDPRVRDPNGDYRTVYQHEHTTVSEPTWDKLQRIIRRDLTANDRLRIEGLVNNWQEDLETYQRMRAEGQWDAAEYSRRAQQLQDGMKKRFKEMLDIKPDDADRMLLLLQ
ncbi:MAG: hypothetical protein IT370_11995 [Deltaproteobacteria bacterium]|nr:hypothetical protein [Deltaproteobacteria bacterium]